MIFFATLTFVRFKFGVVFMKKVVAFFIKLISIVGIFAVVFAVSVYGGYLYITPSSYVSLNSIPSVKFSVNNFDRVLKVETGNESEDIISDLKLNNMKIYEAVQKTVDELVSEGYISNNSSLIISVSNKDENKTSRLMNKLQNKITINIDGSSEIHMVKVKPLLK